MARKTDPVARLLDDYRALTNDQRLAADYLMRRESKGEHIVAPAKRGRPVGSKNRQADAPLIDGAIEEMA